MTWTAPLGNAVDFAEAASYTAPAGNAVNFDEGFTGEEFARLRLAVTVTDSTRVALPLEVLVGPMVALPVSVSVVDSSAPVELPLRVTVSVPGVVEVPFAVEVIDAAALGGLDGAGAWAAAPDGLWRPVVTLGGADISARLVGQIIVTHADDAAAVAELALLPAAALQPLSLIGQPVRIAFARADGSSRQAMFAGVVDVPQIDLATGVITLRCHDQAQEVWSRTPRETIAALVGGRYSAAVVGDEPEDNYDYLQERIQSVGASWAVDVLGRPRVIPWDTTARTVTVRTDDVLDGSLGVELPSREQLRTRITCRLQYQYTRLRYRGVQAQYSQDVHFFKPFISATVNYPGVQFLTTAMVKGACESVPGFDLVGEPDIEHPPARSWPVGNSIISGVFTIPPNVAPDLALGFTATFATRWQQSLTEDWTVDVVWPAMEAQLGTTVAEEIGTSLVAEFDQPGWESDATMLPAIPNAVGVGDATLAWQPAGFDAATRDEALRTLLDRAWVRLWSASRSGRVSFDVPLRPDLWLDTRVTLEHARVRAAGKISEVTHTMDAGSGAAISTVTFAVGMPGATPAALPAWTLPAAPVDDYAPALSAFSFEIGTFVGGKADSAPFDEETMIGFATNLNSVTEAGREYYPHQLSMRAPDIAAEDRDPRTLPTSSQIDVTVPTDLLEILAP